MLDFELSMPPAKKIDDSFKIELQNTKFMNKIIEQDMDDGATIE